MAKIINSTYITLDGVVEAPHLWPSSGREGDERAGQIQTGLLLTCDAVLMGRHTYDGFAPVWPTRSGDPMSDRINAMPKYVASTTLQDPEWNNTRVIAGDVAGEVARLKETLEGDIVQYGFGVVTRLLLAGGAARRAAPVGAPAHARQRQGRRPALRRPGRAGGARADRHDHAQRRDRDPRLPGAQRARVSAKAPGP